MEKPSVTVGEAAEAAHKALAPKPSSPAPKLMDVVQHVYGRIMDDWNKYVQSKLEEAGRWDAEIGITRKTWKEFGGPEDGFLTTADVTAVLLDKKLRFRRPIVTATGAPLAWAWFNPSAHDKKLMEKEKTKKTVLPQVEMADEKEWDKVVAEHKGDVVMSGIKPVSVTAAVAPDPQDPPADLDQFDFRLVNVFPLELARCMHVTDRGKNGVKGKLYAQLGFDVQLDTATLTGQLEEGWQSSLVVKLSHQEYAKEAGWGAGKEGNLNTSRVYVIEDEEVYVFLLTHPGNFETEKEKWCRKFYELVRPQIQAEALKVTKVSDDWIAQNGFYEREPGRCESCKGPQDRLYMPELSYWLSKEGDTVIVDYGYGGGGTRSWFPLDKRAELHDVLQAVHQSEQTPVSGTKPLPWKFRDAHRPYVHVKFGPGRINQWSWFPTERLDELILLTGEAFDLAAAKEKGSTLVSDVGRQQAERKSKANKKLREDAKRLAETVVEEPEEGAPPAKSQKDLFRGQ